MPSRHVTIVHQNEFCFTPSDEGVTNVNNLFYDDFDQPTEDDESNPHTPLFDPHPTDSSSIPDEEIQPPSAPSTADNDDSPTDQDHEEFVDSTVPTQADLIADVAPEVIGNDTQYIYLTDKELRQYQIDNPTATLTATDLKITKPTGLRGRPPIATRFMINCIIRPNDIRSALSGPEGEYWQSAMRKEYNSLVQNQTWTLVRRPEGVKPV